MQLLIAVLIFTEKTVQRSEESSLKNSYEGNPARRQGGPRGRGMLCRLHRTIQGYRRPKGFTMQVSLKKKKKNETCF